MAAATSPANSSCTIQGLLQLAKTLAERLSEHENNTENILSEAEELNKDIKSLKTYKDEVDNLNENNRCRPRAQLVKVVQFENKKIKDLQRENQELKQALEENQNAMELIMSKYREHVYTLSQYAKLDFKSLHSNYQMELEQKNKKILEMVALMQHVVRLDESSSFTSEQKIAQLESENRTLRELLSVSKQFASSVRPAAASNPFSPSVGSSNASPDLASPVGSSASTDDLLEGRSSSFSSENGSTAASANYNLVSTVKKRPLPSGEPTSPSARPQNSINQSDSGFLNGVKSNGSGSDVKVEPSTPPNSLTGNNSSNSGFGLVNGSVNFTLSSTSNNNNYQFINNDDPKSGAAGYECLRNGPNKVLVVSAPLDGNSSTFGVGGDSSVNDVNIINSHSSNNNEGYMIYRQPSDNDIVSDTDSDSSSSNASTVTLTPCTSDREDDEPCPMVPDSLMISSPPQDVVAAVTPFKTVPKCLTNGCIGDYHSTSTAAPSQLSLDDETTTPVMASAASNLTNGIP